MSTRLRPSRAHLQGPFSPSARLRLNEVEAAGREVDRLYARWSELERSLRTDTRLP